MENVNKMGEEDNEADACNDVYRSSNFKSAYNDPDIVSKYVVCQATHGAAGATTEDIL